MTREKIADMFFKFTGTAIVLLAVWGFFFQFTIWPWVDDWCWWYGPQLVTTAVIAIYVGGIGIKISEL